MKKLFYMFALVGAVMLTACDPNELTPEGDKTKLWFAGVDGEDVGGFINADGKMVIPAKYWFSYYTIFHFGYVYLPQFSCGWACVWDEEEGRYVYIDKDGKAGNTDEDLTLYDFYYNYAPFEDNTTGKEGMLDKDLKVAIPADYYWIGDMGDNELCYFMENEGDKYGYLDKNGKVAIEPDFDDAYDFWGGIAKVQVKKNDVTYYGIIDGKGNYLIDLQKKYIFNAGEGLVGFQNTNGKYGLWDKKGNEVLPATYDDMWGFSCGLSMVKKNGKYGYINTKGEVEISLSYQSASPFYDDIAWAYKNDRWEAINKKGESLFKLKDNETYLTCFHNGLALVLNTDNYEFRYVNKEGKPVYKWTHESEGVPEMPLRRAIPTTEKEHNEQILRMLEGTEYYPLFCEKMGIKEKRKINH